VHTRPIPFTCTLPIQTSTLLLTWSLLWWKHSSYCPVPGLSKFLRTTLEIRLQTDRTSGAEASLISSTVTPSTRCYEYPKAVEAAFHPQNAHSL